VLLEVEYLTVWYGKVIALDDISFNINEGEIIALIGPNGAGKSTALRSIAGLLDSAGGAISRGTVKFEGEIINGLRTDQLVERGISLAPERRRIFPNMTVRENLEMGAFSLKSAALIENNMNSVFNLFPLLKERIRQKAGTLSTGEQQMLSLGRALMLKPKLLLADEPSLGLSPNYVDSMADKLTEINKLGTAILLVEQNAAMALEISNRAYVFAIGRVNIEGYSSELLQKPEVKKAFLGR
jgi:branched-chain amino acid transport system ATP-binding protein